MWREFTREWYNHCRKRSLEIRRIVIVITLNYQFEKPFEWQITTDWTKS